MAFGFPVLPPEELAPLVSWLWLANEDEVRSVEMLPRNESVCPMLLEAV